jgi:hypothetical protein
MEWRRRGLGLRLLRAPETVLAALPAGRWSPEPGSNDEGRAMRQVRTRSPPRMSAAGRHSDTCLPSFGPFARSASW